MLWFGINSLVFGGILILVSHFTTRQPVLQPSAANGRFAVVDRKAAHINAALDILGTVGIVSFVVAGLVIVIAILLPTYCNRYCFEDRDVELPPAALLAYTSLSTDEPTCSVPVTQQVLSVQPERKVTESASLDDENHKQLEPGPY